MLNIYYYCTQQNTLIVHTLIHQQLTAGLVSPVPPSYSSTLMKVLVYNNDACNKLLLQYTVLGVKGALKFSI